MLYVIFKGIWCDINMLDMEFEQTLSVPKSRIDTDFKFQVHVFIHFI